MIRNSLLLSFGAMLLLSGCGEPDAIHTETVPKPPPDTTEPKVRLLAAILEDKGEQWFFKLLGSVDDIKKHTESFAAFIQSVRLTGKADAPIDWKVPAGWEAGPKKELRYATFFLGGKDKPPELTVFKFDRVSSVLDNVNRWCDRDLGRAPLRERELKKIAQTVKAGDKEVTLIDLSGPGAKAPPMHAGMPKKMPKPLPIEYTTPAGWDETGPRPGFVPTLTAFTLDDGPPRSEVTIIVMRGQTGELLDNYNRWRGQVGAGKAEKLPDVPTVEVGGSKGMLFDIEGDRRMLLAMVKRGIATWYIKAIGSKDVIAKNKPAFETFLKSIKFNGGADE